MSKNNLNIIGKNDKINVKNFENIDEFNDYYKLHEEEINKLSTVKLNRMYHIKDFKIIRRKIDGNETKQLCYQQIFKTNVDNLHDENRFEELEQSLTELNSKIKSLELENNKIKQQLIEIIKVINSNS